MIRILLACLLTLALFEPLGILLRGQNPWTCFQSTYDENVFVDAIGNHLNGKGFRLTGDEKPYNPIITVGPALSIATQAGSLIAKDSLVQSARAGIYLTFLAVLLWIARHATRQSLSIGGAIIAVSIFTYWHSRTQAGPYLTYGILGEIPGLLFALLALGSLDRGKLWSAGVLGVLAFWTKPTFLFLLPTLVLSASGLKARIRVLLSSGLGLVGVMLLISHSRGEGLLEYIQTFLYSARQITQDASKSTVWDAIGDAKLGAWLVVIAAGISALTSKLRAHRGALIFFFLGFTYFLFRGKPMPKHAWVFCAPLVALGASALADRPGRWIASLFGEERLRAVLVTIVVVWLAWIPSGLKRTFASLPIEGCPVKEQREITERIRGKALADDSVWVVIPSSGDSRWLRLDSRVPRELGSLDEFRHIMHSSSKGSIHWIAAPAAPAPEAKCTTEWVGKNYGAWRCQN